MMWRSMKTLLMIAVLIGLHSCYEPVEGCLNVRASNFDIDADEGCDDCCTFPQFKVKFENIWNDGVNIASFDVDTFYHDAENHAFRVKQIRFYWSALSIPMTTGSSIQTLDSLSVDIAENGDTSMVNLENSMLLAVANDGLHTSTLGRIEASGVALGIEGLWGFTDLTNQVVTTSVSPSSHPLAPQLGVMNLGAEDGYVFAKVEFYQDTTAIDTVARVINLFGNHLVKPIGLSLPVASTLVEGFDQVFVVENNVAKWFDGVDVRTSDTTLLKQQFFDNMLQAFQLLEVYPD